MKLLLIMFLLSIVSGNSRSDENYYHAEYLKSSPLVVRADLSPAKGVARYWGSARVLEVYKNAKKIEIPEHITIVSRKDNYPGQHGIITLYLRPNEPFTHDNRVWKLDEVRFGKRKRSGYSHTSSKAN